MPTTPVFEKAYKGLNKEQKKAVDTVEGPVLVVAGPGTGKTHILTLRIANILKETDTKPENILVLTFTDSAARTISNRLGKLIGDDFARKVGVYTFHSFAEHVMKEHPEAFPEIVDRRLMGEVEQILLWRDILEKKTTSKLRTAKSPFHYLKDLKSLEDVMTRECMTLEAYDSWLSEEVKRIKDDPVLRYVRAGKGGDVGDMKPAGIKRLERLEKGKEAIELIREYRSVKDARGLYGYTDVLRIAVDGITEDEALRADLQEQYQYVLADEHQDANALQHALLDGLAYDDHPNLFIVGDEKQAVFGFQGADTTHFATFLTLYPRAVTIKLVENFRSYQSVLDLSHTLLANLPSLTGGHVELIASRGKGGSVHLLQAEDTLSERDQIATLVQNAITEGVPPHEIAIITLKNKTADLFALTLRARGIPTLRAGNIDLTGRPSIRFLLAFMQAIADPTDIPALREALLAPWWNESIAERTAFLRRVRDHECTSALETTFPTLAGVIAKLQTDATRLPPLTLFSRLLADSGARTYFLSDGEQIAEDVPLVRELLMHVEDLVRRNPNAIFAEVMDGFAKAREHEVGSIKTSLTQKEEHVTVITAHKAKGMEFERVFVPTLTAREWEGRGKSVLIPSPFDGKRETEEITRLFYVALTRAKNALVLSYPLHGSEGKEETPMSLIPSGITPTTIHASPIPLLHADTNVSALVRDLTERYLLRDGLSPSAYNEYLVSPSAFFAKRVLRLKEPENRAIVLGNAVHAAIAAYLREPESTSEARRAAAHHELTKSLERSLLPRNETFDELTRHARASFDTYVGKHTVEQKAVAIEEAFSVKRVVDGKDILLKGKVDAVFSGTDGECIVDFKTSSSIHKKDKEKFERQIAFYDLLLRANGHNTTTGRIVQVGEDDITDHDVALTDVTRKELETTLAAVLSELLSGKWRKGEPSEYDALLNGLS